MLTHQHTKYTNTPTQQKMKYAIICGSHRENSQSVKVAQYLENRIKELYPEAETYLLELATANVPFWDPGVWAGEDKWKTIWSPIAAELQSSDAIIPITPEWSGMATPMLKNFFLLASGRELGHKPGLIVSVSSGRGGAYPVSELRTSSYKNNQICFIPEHLVLRFITDRLNETEAVDESDAITRERIDFALNMLHTYAEAFKGIRKQEHIYNDKFKFGM